MRIRTIKPEVHKNEELWFLEIETGLPIFRAYTGLWGASDREGRFEWRPLRLKTDILPYWEGDFSRVLDALATRAFLVKYTIGTRDYGWIPTLKDHQCFNNREAASKLPPPPQSVIDTYRSTRDGRVDDASATREARVQENLERALAEGKGREGKGTVKGRVDDASSTREKEPAVLGSTNPEVQVLTKPECEALGFTVDDSPPTAIEVVPDSQPPSKLLSWRDPPFVWQRVISCWIDKTGHPIDALSNRDDAEAIARQCQTVNAIDPFEPLGKVFDRWLADEWVKKNRPGLTYLRRNFQKYIDDEPSPSAEGRRSTYERDTRQQEERKREEREHFKTEDPEANRAAMNSARERIAQLASAKSLRNSDNTSDKQNVQGFQEARERLREMSESKDG